MAVNVQVGLPVYNKSPPPTKEPPKSLFPIKVLLGDDRQVWVSAPQPDKLHLIGDLLPNHFTAPAVSAEHLGPSLMDALAAEQVGPVLGTKLSGKIYRAVQVGFGSAETPVYFQLKNAMAQSPASHRLLIQLNPRALGQEGLYELLDKLHKGSGQKFKVGAFLAEARINRLDVAVDCIGIGVPEILISATSAGKHVQYYGVDGVLETVAIHKKQKPVAGATRGLGALLVMAYDKRRERISAGEQPPFAPAEVTRIEVSKTRFGPKPFRLKTLSKLGNALAHVKVGTVQAAAPHGGTAWFKYVEARRGGGPDRAAVVLNLTPANAAVLAASYEQHPSDLINTKAVWKHWTAGIAATGTNYLIEAADQGSSGVPLPPEA
jgi:hypothetical protein